MTLRCPLLYWYFALHHRETPGSSHHPAQEEEAVAAASRRPSAEQVVDMMECLGREGRHRTECCREAHLAVEAVAEQHRAVGTQTQQGLEQRGSAVGGSMLRTGKTAVLLAVSEVEERHHRGTAGCMEAKCRGEARLTSAHY